MGQYHKIISLTAGEYLNPTDYDNGNKLTEMAWSSGGVLEALTYKLLSDWKGHRIALVGDYGRKSDFSEEALIGIPTNWHNDMYDYIDKYFENGKTPPITYLNDSPHVIMNFSKNEFISPEGYGDNTSPNVFARDAEGGILESLIVLLASACKGGARGGGDVDSDSELVGSWAGDSIAVIPAVDLPANAVCLDAAMRQVMVDGDDILYAVDGDKVQRAKWDYLTRKRVFAVA